MDGRMHSHNANHANDSIANLLELTAVLLVRVVSAVALAVAAPVVRDAVIVLAAELMRTAGLLI